jgi:hypothetical protein
MAMFCFIYRYIDLSFLSFLLFSYYRTKRKSTHDKFEKRHQHIVDELGSSQDDEAFDPPPELRAVIKRTPPRVEVPSLALSGLGLGLGGQSGLPQDGLGSGRGLLREASEELISAPAHRPSPRTSAQIAQGAQRRPPNVPHLGFAPGNGNGTNSFLTTVSSPRHNMSPHDNPNSLINNGINSYSNGNSNGTGTGNGNGNGNGNSNMYIGIGARQGSGRQSSSSVGTPRGASTTPRLPTPRLPSADLPSADRRDDSGDEFKRAVEEWIAPTPRAVAGTPRGRLDDADSSTVSASVAAAARGTPRTPREGQGQGHKHIDISMPPPTKVIRGGRGKRLEERLSLAEGEGRVDSLDSMGHCLAPSASLSASLSAGQAEQSERDTDVPIMQPVSAKGRVVHVPPLALPAPPPSPPPRRAGEVSDKLSISANNSTNISTSISTGISTGISGSALNAHRVLGMGTQRDSSRGAGAASRGGQGRKSMSERRKSMETDSANAHTPTTHTPTAHTPTAHSRDRSDLSDPAKRFSASRAPPSAPPSAAVKAEALGNLIRGNTAGGLSNASSSSSTCSSTCTSSTSSSNSSTTTTSRLAYLILLFNYAI